ncbi:sensor histidine kinase [Specibacter sp. NPDC057265]|uniref:sensor histidine kinase n=1 Tax=Specibacter sp. NPDC057265 TaxID=3346075 RepID=UPI00362A6C06
MRTMNQAGKPERTAAFPAEPPSVERRAEEFSARRLGVVRKYFRAHPRIMDLVVVLVYLVAGSGVFVSGNYQIDLAPHMVIVLASAVVLMFRRDHPLTVLAILSVFEVINLAVVPIASNVGASVWFGLYAVGVKYKPVPSFLLAVLAAVPLTMYLLLLYQYPQDFLAVGGPSAEVATSISVIIMLFSNVLSVGIGASVRRSRAHEQELQQWAVRNSQLASVAERNRIAREMHDVVAHSLTVMVALSDGAAVVVKRNPSQAAQVMDQISQTGRTALADMRRVLGVLRDSGGANRSPQPDSANMTDLIDGFRHAGLPITFSQTGPAILEDPSLALTVYRIVQESLTNVLRYATAVSRVQVELTNNPTKGLLRIVVRDDGHGALNAALGAGHGIVGMQERARFYAGTVHAGPQPQGGWLVEAVLHPAEGP